MPRIVVAYLKGEKIGPYLAALAACGLPEADLFRATPSRTAAADLREVAAGADGLLLTGGADLQPCLYREPRLPEAGLDPPAPERDQMEWDLLSAARLHRLPVFAICRGHQMINVFLGGSLFQDLPLQAGRTGHGCFVEDGFALDHLAHEVRASGADHEWARWLGARAPLAVNSRHHQAVKRVAPGLLAAAAAPDGTIEATAWHDPAWWLRTVQWHPENLIGVDHHRELFVHFLEAADRFAARRPVAEVAR